MSGRPSEFTDETAAEICERLSNGESLHAICALDHMPGRETVRRWRKAHPDFETRCAQARVEALDGFEDQMMVEALAAKNKDSAACAKVRISTLQWIASKRDPKRYGDRTQLEVGGVPGAPIQSVVLNTSDPAEAAKAYQRLMGVG